SSDSFPVGSTPRSCILLDQISYLDFKQHNFIKNNIDRTLDLVLTSLTSDVCSVEEGESFLPLDPQHPVHHVSCILPNLTRVERESFSGFNFRNFDKSLHIDNKTNVSPLVFQKHFSDIINTKYSNHVIAYTDGSKSVNSVSCAYLIDQHVFSIRLNQVTSIFSAELMGIFLCLLNIQFLPATRFLVVSDSMSALEAIKSNNYNNPLISKIYNQWVKLETYGKYLSFMWCPSHIGIKGNEAVDQAASNPSLTLNPIKACSDQDFKPLIAKIIKTRWQNSWNSIPSTNKLKQTKPLVDPWDSSNRNTRVEEVVLTRVRIGHTRLTHIVTCSLAHLNLPATVGKPSR
ncbi:hypothetical protein WDU94_012221, partial [Cyamophila willieti]